MIRDAMTAYIESKLARREQGPSDRQDRENEQPILIEGEVRKYIEVEINDEQAAEFAKMIFDEP